MKNVTNCELRDAGCELTRSAQLVIHTSKIVNLIEMANGLLYLLPLG